MRALVTGFGPFPGVDDNPTERMIAAVPGLAPAGIEFVTAVFAAEYGSVETVLRVLLADRSLDAVVLTGLRTSGDEVGIERVALNLDDSAKPDHAGETRRGSPIAPDGPPAWISPLNLEALCECFEARGIRAGISNHAGAYICNRLYYLAQGALAEMDLTVPCVFVHVPWVGHDDLRKGDGTPLTVADLARGVLDCARHLADG